MPVAIVVLLSLAVTTGAGAHAALQAGTGPGAELGRPSDVAALGGRMWALGPQGEPLYQLTGGDDSDPALSPGGRYLAYLTLPEDQRGRAPTRRDLCLRTLPDGPTTCLGRPALRSAVAWSPAGTWLVYVADGALLVYDPASGRERLLASNLAADGAVYAVPAWVDGAVLALLPEVGGSRLWLIDAVTGARRPAGDLLAPSAPAPAAGRVNPSAPTAGDWYRYQGEADANHCPASSCGAAGVAMAIQFAHNGQRVSVNDISSYMGICAYGGSDYTTAGRALDHWGVRRVWTYNMSGLRTAVNNGHIVLAIVSTGALRRAADYLAPNSDPAQHFDRYYSYVGGHFVVVKGITADNAWVIVNDPYVFNGNGVYWYGDGSPKGRERYYRYSDFASAYWGSGLEITPDPPPPDARFAGQAVPAAMYAGFTYSVTLSYTNTGGVTWAPEAGYMLGSQGPQDNMTWGRQRAPLGPGGPVAPGGLGPFSFTVRAPAEPGSYAFQWQMLQEGVAWFGERSPAITITVLPRPAWPVWAYLPQIGRDFTP